MSHRDVPRWATEESAACIGRPRLGRIPGGTESDLALFTIDELRCSGGLDPIASPVLCGAYITGRAMTEGRWALKDGAIPGLDIAALVRRHNAARALQTG